MWTVAIVVYVAVAMLLMFVAGVAGKDSKLWWIFIWPVIVVAVLVLLPFFGLHELGTWVGRKRGY